MHEPSEEADRLARIVVDAALCVHRALGAGYLESIYEESLCVELTSRNVPFRRQLRVEIHYRKHLVGTHCIDLLVGEELVVELKAVDALAPVHTAQVRSYLAATGLELGLLINFNVRLIREGIRRVVHTFDSSLVSRA